MQMDAGLDTGPMIAEARTAIHDDDTTATLHDKLAASGARLIVEALATLERDSKLPVTPQPEDGATYAQKIGKQEAALDWRRTAAELARQVRAFDPFPGGAATLDGTQIKIWSATAVAAPRASAQPGTIVEVSPEGVVVTCGDGALRVTQLQKPGGKRLPAREFLTGSTLAAGQRFEPASEQ
jgi:methionyl-tRNA formyltransferase